jgi:hypothetical protein
MAKCAAITSAGTTCKAIPMSGEVYCYVHHPDYQEKRRVEGRKGGKRGGRGRPLREVADAKKEIRRVIQALEDGKIERGIGAVMFQGWSLMLKALETERNNIETTELAQQVDELEQALGVTKQGGRRVS